MSGIGVGGSALVQLLVAMPVTYMTLSGIFWMISKVNYHWTVIIYHDFFVVILFILSSFTIQIFLSINISRH